MNPVNPDEIKFYIGTQNSPEGNVVVSLCNGQDGQVKDGNFKGGGTVIFAVPARVWISCEKTVLEAAALIAKAMIANMTGLSVENAKTYWAKDDGSRGELLQPTMPPPPPARKPPTESMN